MWRFDTRVAIVSLVTGTVAGAISLLAHVEALGIIAGVYVIFFVGAAASIILRIGDDRPKW